MQINLHFCMNDFPPMVIASRLKTKVERRGISQAQLAANTGVHQSQLSRILRGDFKRIGKNVRKVCHFLSVKPRDFQRSNPRLAKAITALWDGSRKHERVLIHLLKAVEAIRTQRD
jgi:transcriptional regulator with XRE-family HTH domain